MAYTKFKDPWAITDELTGEAWNHLETQWSAIKSDIDAHSHDTRYYTKTLADATFFSLTYYTGFDADMVDGSHFTDLVAAVMPIGASTIWSGTDGDVPSGWHVCDGGTYGGYATPDLRDRFVVGAGDTYGVNATGGPASWNGTITPTGTVTVGDHILTTAELPTHTHTFAEHYPPQDIYHESGAIDPSGVLASVSRNIEEQTSGDGAHGHTGSTISITAIDPRPVYYSLFYIMKYV